MKTYLHPQFIDESLLTDKQRQQIDTGHRDLLTAIEKKYVLQQQEMMQAMDNLFDRLAVEAGFTGLSTGNDSYESNYQLYIKNPKGTAKDITDKLRTFSMLKIQNTEYAALVERGKQAEILERDERHWAEQLRLNKVLQCIHTRSIPRKDNAGRRIIGPRTYNMLADAVKKELCRPVVQEFILNKNDKVSIDMGISQYVNKLWQLNVRTNASCSGMVGDHPYHRREDDDRFGRWKRGDLQISTATVSGAYLSIPYKDNHPELLKRAAEKARDWGWVTENRHVYDEESLVFYPPHTLDGSDYGTVLHEAGLHKVTFLSSGEASDVDEARYLAMQKAEDMHGGVIHYTDRMLDYNFKRLADGMAELLSRIRLEEREKNIRDGKAVTLYRYDTHVPPLDARQVKDVFARSGIELDMRSINRRLNSDCVFLVHQGRAKLLPENAPELPWTMVEDNHLLSYLMAQQVKSTPHTSDSDMTVTFMVHPAPQSAEVNALFTITKPLATFDSYRYFSDNGDMNQLLSKYFAAELYQAARHCSDYGLQRDGVDASASLLSDIRIRRGMDRNLYISCKVDGEQQLSKRLNTADANYYSMRMHSGDKAYNAAATELAVKYYAEELDLAKSLDQKAGRGMKR